MWTGGASSMGLDDSDVPICAGVAAVRGQLSTPPIWGAPPTSRTSSVDRGSLTGGF
jgi:hypothetical protein